MQFYHFWKIVIQAERIFLNLKSENLKWDIFGEFQTISYFGKVFFFSSLFLALVPQKWQLIYATR